MTTENISINILENPLIVDLYDVPAIFRTSTMSSERLSTQGFTNLIEIPEQTSHRAIWRYIIDKQLPVAHVFYTNVHFHPAFGELSPHLFEATPTDWDVIFMGNWLQYETNDFVTRQPTAKAFAYTITYQGAVKLDQLFGEGDEYESHIHLQKALYTCMIETPLKFTWYCWNGVKFPTDLGEPTDTGFIFDLTPTPQ